MGRYTLVLLAFVGLALAGEPRLDDRSAWREACELSRYSCWKRKRPVVVQAPLQGLYGRYRVGDSYILIHERLTGNLAYAVKVHEMVHYLQHAAGVWKYTKESSCAREAEAFEVANKVLRRLGEPALIVDWNEMRLVYGC